MMMGHTYVIPEDLLPLEPGDVVGHRGVDGHWTVYGIEELVLVSRLVPLRFDRGIEFIEERNISDAVTPHVSVIVTAFSTKHATIEDARRAHAGGRHADVSGLCVDILRFKKADSVLLARQVRNEGRDDRD